MSCKKGDIVLIPFPFTDGKAHKKRPALVISNKEHHEEDFGKYVCLALTSQEAKDKRFEHKIVKWSEAGLPKKSWVVVNKTFSTEDAFIEKELGEMDTDDLRIVMEMFNSII